MGSCITKLTVGSSRRGHDGNFEPALQAPRSADTGGRSASPAGSHLSELRDLSRSSSSRSQEGHGGQQPRRPIEQDLTAIRSSLRGMQDMKAAIDSDILPLDAALLPIAVKAENVRSAEKCRNTNVPHVPLHHFPQMQALCAAVRDGELQDGRAVFNLRADHDHVVSADVRTVGPMVSIMILEPVDHFSTRKLLESSLQEMAGFLPPHVAVSVLVHDSQKNKLDCPIFALHAASKMIDERPFLDKLHAENVSMPASGAMSTLARQKHTQVGPYRIVDAHTILPPAFYKHAQSTKAVKNAFKDRREALREPVNKNNETLLERLEKNRDFRLDFNREVSTSMEEKRIAYLGRARGYLEMAPHDEVHDMTAASAATAPNWFKKSQAAVDEETNG